MASKGCSLLTQGQIFVWRRQSQRPLPILSHPLTYDSEGIGLTSRLQIRASGDTEQRYTWQTQHGYLVNTDYLQNQEPTIFIRVHKILDASRAL